MSGPTRRVLLTGASAGGKSTLLAELARRGVATLTEPGRRVIAVERASGGSAFPWQDEDGFARRALALAMADFTAAGPGPVVFDRGTLDVLCYYHRIGQSLPPAALALRYDLVVLVPPWPGIAAPDPDRRADPAAVLKEWQALCTFVPAQGYAPLMLPRLPVPERADWLLARL